MNSVLQYVLYVGILVAFAIPLGFYMSKVMDGEKTIVSRVLGPVERGIYKLLRIDPEEDMGWKKYLAAALLFNLFGFMKQTAGHHRLCGKSGRTGGQTSAAPVLWHHGFPGDGGAGHSDGYAEQR